MKNKLLVTAMILGLVFSSIALADSLFSGSGGQGGKSKDRSGLKDVISFDASAFNVDDDLLKRAAAKAFMARSWTVTKIGDRAVVGTIKGNVKAKIHVDQFPTIKIGYVKGDNKKWLLNLKKDFLVELVACNRL